MAYARKVYGLLTKFLPLDNYNPFIALFRNYTKIFPIPGNLGHFIQIVFIDTTTLNPSANGCCNEKGGVSVADQKKLIQDQLFHIENMLKAARGVLKSDIPNNMENGNATHWRGRNDRLKLDPDRGATMWLWGSFVNKSLACFIM